MRVHRTDAGVALVATLLAMFLMLALAAAVVMTTTSEILIASSYKVARETFYAAEAAAELTLGGIVFTDGPPSGARALPDGSTIELAGVLAAATGASGSPAWQLSSYGPLRNMLPPSDRPSACYIVVMTADDPSISDSGVRVMRAEAFGPRGAHRVVQLTWSAADVSGFPRVFSWHEMR